MMKICGLISTEHENATGVAASLAPDNLRNMTTEADDNRVMTVIEGSQIRSVIASVDDYLMNLVIADDTAGLSHCRQEKQEMRE